MVIVVIIIIIIIIILVIRKYTKLNCLKNISCQYFYLVIMYAFIYFMSNVKSMFLSNINNEQ